MRYLVTVVLSAALFAGVFLSMSSPPTPAMAQLPALAPAQEVTTTADVDLILDYYAGQSVVRTNAYELECGGGQHITNSLDADYARWLCNGLARAYAHR